MNTRKPVLELSRENSTMLKGFAILMVLLGHLYYIPFGGAVGVAVFLGVSGYGLNVALEKNGLRLFWRKRLRAVWFPYVPVALFDLLFLKVRGAASVLCTVLGLDFSLNADSTMWYVSYTMAWYLVFYLAAWISAHIPGKILPEALKLLCLFGAAFGIRYLSQRGVWSPASGSAVYYLAFPLGVALSHLRRLTVSERVWTGLWVAVLFFSSAYLFRFYPYEWVSPLLTSTAFAQAVALLQLLEFPRIIKNGLLFFGRYSYPLYLFEGLILQVRAVWFAGLVMPLLINLAFIVFTSAMAVIYWTCYKKLEAAFLPTLK